MLTLTPHLEIETTWVDICPISTILPFTGVAALVAGDQVAIFRLASEDECYAISNYDPFSDAWVLSRGLVGDKNGVIKVASPIYKHNFNLLTGECLDDVSVKLPTYPVEIVAGMVRIALEAKQ